MTPLPRLALLSTLVALLACERPTPLADVGLSASAVRFEAPGADGDPAPQSIYVVNAGEGSVAAPRVAIAFQHGAGWLSAAVKGAGAPYEIELRARVGTLSPGSYRATLTVTSDSASGAPLQAEVTLVVPEPRFALSAPALTFQAPRGGGNPVAQQVLVTNGGRGALPVPQVSVTYAGAGGWLAADVGAASAGYSVDARADVAGLASGSYSAVLTFTAAGDAAPPRTLGVTLVVPPVELALSTSSVLVNAPADGSPPPEVELLALNAGGGIMAPPVLWGGDQAPWLRGATVVPGAGPPYRILVHTRSEGIPSGEYAGRLWFRTSLDAQEQVELRVTLVVPPPRVRLEPDVISFSPDTSCPLPAPRRLAIHNGGPGVLAPPVALVDPQDSGWLEVKVSGTRAPYLATVRLLAMPPLEVPPGPFPGPQLGTVGRTVRITAPGGALEGSLSVWVVGYGPVPPVTAWIDSPPVAIRAQRGAGDPGPVALPIATSSGCVPPPSVEPVDADGKPVGWLSASAAFAGAPIVLQASAAGMANGATRTAYLRTDLPVPVPPDLSALPGHPVTLTAADPVSAPPLGTPRFGHALAVGDDGRAVVLGGFDSGFPRFGKSSSGETFFGPGAGWAFGPHLLTARARHGAISRGRGGMLVIGGFDGFDSIQASTRVEWVVGTISQEGTFPELPGPAIDPVLVRLPEEAYSATQHEVFVLPTAPVNNGPPLGVAYVYGLQATPRSVFLGTERFQAAVGLADGRVLVAGGGTAAAIYDPVLDAVEPTGSLALGREKPKLLLLGDGRVLALGGRDDLSAETWDPTTGAWSAAAQPACLPVNVVSLSNGRVASVGGDPRAECGGGASVEVYDPAADAWTRLPDLAAGLGATPLVRLPDGMVVGAGSAYLDPNDRVITW